MNKNINLYKNILWATLTLFLIAVAFSLLFQQVKEPIKLTVSELVGKINQGLVEKISVQGNDLLIDLRGGEKAISKKETEAGLTQTLNNYGVDSSALKSVSLEVKDESGTLFWFGVLFPTLLPLIVIGFMFWFIFRQAKAGANQAFSFGRSNIKMFG